MRLSEQRSIDWFGYFIWETDTVSHYLIRGTGLGQCIACSKEHGLLSGFWWAAGRKERSRGEILRRFIGRWDWDWLDSAACMVGGNWLQGFPVSRRACINAVHGGSRKINGNGKKGQKGV